MGVDPIVNERIFICRACHGMQSVTITRMGRLASSVSTRCDKTRECQERAASKAAFGIVAWDRVARRVSGIRTEH